MERKGAGKMINAMIKNKGNTQDGDLYVSFWNSGNDYAIMSRDDLNEYIENRQGKQFGGI